MHITNMLSDFVVSNIRYTIYIGPMLSTFLYCQHDTPDIANFCNSNPDMCSNSDISNLAPNTSKGTSI